MHACDAALPILSVAEALLYVQVTPCEACGGPLTEAGGQSRSYDHDQHLLTCPVTCRACGQARVIRFDTAALEPRTPLSGDLRDALALSDPLTARTINPGQEPSRIIDVAGWLTLHSMIADQARADAGATGQQRSAVRWLQLRAAQCLTEALKFYEVDNDLPPDDAFYREGSRSQFRQRPEAFTRQRLIELRARLPHLPPPPVEPA